MADLISREAAVRALASSNGDYLDALERFERLPAVDAVPVIRCEICKWWNGSTLGAAHRCAALHIATTGEFYCAAAEWKSNAFSDQCGACMTRLTF